MAAQNPLKWTFRLLKIQLFCLILGVASIGVAVLLGAWPNKEGAIFMIASFLGFAYLIFQTRKGLLEKKENAWNFALVISALCLCSIILPLAIFSLIELFNNEAKKEYFKKTQTEGEAEIPVYSFPPVKTDNSLKKLVIICGTLFLLLVVYLNFDRFVGKSEISVDKNLSVQQLYQIGADCNTKGNLKCSIAIFKRLLEINPNDNAALANLGMSQTQAGLHEEAAQNFQKYFDRGGEALDVMAYYAQSLNALGHQTEALQWYARALAQHPNLIDVLENMVKILADQNRYDEGLALVDRFIEKNPSAAKLLQSRRDFLMEKAKMIRETTI